MSLHATKGLCRRKLDLSLAFKHVQLVGWAFLKKVDWEGRPGESEPANEPRGKITVCERNLYWAAGLGCWRMTDTQSRI